MTSIIKIKLQSLARDIQHPEDDDAPLEGAAVKARIKEIFGLACNEEDILKWAERSLKLRQKTAEVLSIAPQFIQNPLSDLLKKTVQPFSLTCRFYNLQNPLLEMQQGFVAEVDEKEQTICGLNKAIESGKGDKSKRTSKRKELISERSGIYAKNNRYRELFKRAQQRITASTINCKTAQKSMPLFPGLVPLIEQVEKARIDFFVNAEQIELLFDDDIQTSLDTVIESIPQERVKIDQSCLRRVFCCACRVWKMFS